MALKITRRYLIDIVILVIFLSISLYSVLAIRDTSDRERGHFANLITQNNYLIKQNHKSICLFYYLFGLDKPLARDQVRNLRPSQIKALGQLISECKGDRQQ